MTTIERHPGVTSGDWNDEYQVRVGNGLVHLDHLMRDAHPGSEMDMVCYRSQTDFIEFVILQPHARATRAKVEVPQARLVMPGTVTAIAEQVAEALVPVVASIRAGRRRDRRLGRRLDRAGNVVTDVAHWRFDPLFEPMARALGFDPLAPIRLTPSVYQAEPPNGATIAETRVGGTVLKGHVHDDMIEADFMFDEGLVEGMYLSPDAVDIHLREGLPETVVNALRGMPLNRIVAIEGLDPARLARRIEHVEFGEGTRHLGLGSRRYVRIGAASRP